LPFGLISIQTRPIACDLAEANTIRHDFNSAAKLVGKDWLVLFLRRNSTLSSRDREGTNTKRTNVFNESAVTRYFQNLETLMGTYNSHEPNTYKRVFIPSKNPAQF
jgi:hypothetical protein